LVTIRDVAAAAHVSTATVSRVLNKSAEVNPVLAERVMFAVEKLRYKINFTARHLRTNSTQVLALIVPDIENPFFTAVCRGVEDVASRSGYSVMLCNSDDDTMKEEEYISMLASKNVSGVIISPASSKLTDVTPLIERGIKVLAFDRKLPMQTDSVRVDNKTGSWLATQHLLSSGASRVACVNGRRSASTAQERLAGYVEAIEAAGLVVEPELQFFVDFKDEGGFQATVQILEMDDPPDAIFVTNNRMTTGVFHALRKYKIAIPERISLVGFDELPWVDIVTPTVTTVRQPTYEMGIAAANKLLERFNGDESEPEEIVFDPELVIRDSSVKTKRDKSI
jgi:LacI family transcriptional regulator